MSKKRIAFTILFLVAFVVLAASELTHAADQYVAKKQAAIAEMQSNHGLCKSLQCIVDAHDYGWETPEQAYWYDKQYGHVNQQAETAKRAVGFSS